MARLSFATTRNLLALGAAALTLAACQNAGDKAAETRTQRCWPMPPTRR